MIIPFPAIAKLWYGPKSIEEIAQSLRISETEVRVQAVIVHKLGPRRICIRDSWKREGQTVDDRRAEVV